jgi:hypothetical protein
MMMMMMMMNRSSRAIKHQMRRLNTLTTSLFIITLWGDSHMLPSRGVRVWVVYLTPKIERMIVLLSASPEGEARLPMPKGMAYKE